MFTSWCSSQPLNGEEEKRVIAQALFLSHFSPFLQVDCMVLVQCSLPATPFLCTLPSAVPNARKPRQMFFSFLLADVRYTTAPLHSFVTAISCFTIPRRLFSNIPFDSLSRTLSWQGYERRINVSHPYHIRALKTRKMRKTKRRERQERRKRRKLWKKNVEPSFLNRTKGRVTSTFTSRYYWNVLFFRFSFDSPFGLRVGCAQLHPESISFNIFSFISFCCGCGCGCGFGIASLPWNTPNWLSLLAEIKHTDWSERENEKEILVRGLNRKVI